MGTYYSLACYDCKVFIFRGNVIPYHRAAAALFAMYQPEFHPDSDNLRAEVVTVDGMFAYPLTSAALIDEMARRYPGEPKGREELFADDHQGHQLYVFMDLGDMPWHFFVEGTNWMAWKDLTDERDGERDAFLPRNLVEILGFKTWDEALKYIKELSFRPDNNTLENEVKPEFLRLVEKSQQNKLPD